jgi:deoxycytidylate deaminase
MRCTVHIIQAGIIGIVSPPKRVTPSKWHRDMPMIETVLQEAGVRFREISLDGDL